MKWRKMGLIHAPRGDLWWAKSHAYLPTADVIDDQVIRVYFASLDENRYGRIGYVDLDVNDPQCILYEAREPVFDVGVLGTFDDSGVSPSCIIHIDDTRYLYYVGWQRCERVPYMLFTGLATGDDGGDFSRVSQTPVLDRTNDEPFLRSAPIVLLEAGVFRLWYVSGTRWMDVNGIQYPNYVVRYADSDDGIRWRSHNHICIDFENEAEFGFGRPWVVKEQNIYRMWYSIRSRTSPYTIGYAESSDGIGWTRKDREVGIQRSESGWDSEMICFSCVVDVKGKQYMFYNGNRHGATGFGCAVLES